MALVVQKAVGMTQGCSPEQYGCYQSYLQSCKWDQAEWPWHTGEIPNSQVSGKEDRGVGMLHLTPLFCTSPRPPARRITAVSAGPLVLRPEAFPPPPGHLLLDTLGEPSALHISMLVWIVFQSDSIPPAHFTLTETVSGR